MIATLFWSAIGVVAFTYAGFPLLLLARGRVCRRPWKTAEIEPEVSLVVAAHNEAASIAAKLESVLALDYPRARLEILVASDGSDDGTNEIVARYRDRGVELLALPRGGKASALNAAVTRSRGEILVFSDANSLFARDAIRPLVRPFADPAVGGVAGDQRYEPGASGDSADGERRYWDLDRALKRAEAVAGNAVSATGAIYAIRRSLFQRVPDGVTDDFVTSTRVVAQGRRLVFEPAAVAFEPVAGSSDLEFGRKVRIITRGLRGMILIRGLLNPVGHGFYAIQLLWHKLLRRLMVYPLLLLLLLNPFLLARGSVYRWVMAAQLAFYAAALAYPLLRTTRFARLPGVSFASFFCLVNGAALVASWNLLRGRRIDVWEPKRAHLAPDAEPSRSPARLAAVAGHGPAGRTAGVSVDRARPTAVAGRGLAVLAGGGPDPQAEVSDLLPHLQRLDWRFLLADPELARVGYVGRTDSGLLASLRLVSPVVEVLAEPPGPGAREPAAPRYDLVVASEPGGRELARAAAWVRPGGTLVVEARRASRAPRPGSATDGGAPERPLGHPEVIARFPALGFDPPCSYWLWPDFERCTRIIPLDDPAGIRYAFSHGGRGLKHRLGARLGQGLAGLGLLSTAAACVCAIGRRPSPSNASPGAAGTREGRAAPRPRPSHASLVHHFLARRGRELGLDRSAPPASLVVLTPRFRNSTHLVFILLGDGDSAGGLVAKVCRFPGRCRELELEAGQLGSIQSPPRFESIPRLLAVERCEGHTLLLQTALRGRAMDRATVRRHPRECCDLVLAWLGQVQTTTRVVPDSSAAEIDRLVARQLRRLEVMIPSEDGLLAKTTQAVAPLRGLKLPLVLEHGDLSHPNLLLDDRGRLGVTDWEQSELRGLPAVDLFFFLAYVARAREGAPSGPRAVAAVERAFFGRSAWTRPYVRRYAERLDVPLEALTPLFLCCWIRQMAGLEHKISNCRGGSRAQADGFPEWLRGDWRLGAWRLALERAGELDWD